jgi:hypothetical protein
MPRDFTLGQVMSSLAASLIVAVIVMLSKKIAYGDIDERSVKIALLCLYAALASGGVYVLADRQPSGLDSRVRVSRFRRRTKLLTSIGLTAGAALLVWAFLPYSIPCLKLEVRNHKQYGILFHDEAPFRITMPESPASERIVDRGLCSLSWFPTPQQPDKPLVIMRGESAEFKCEILNPIAFRRYLDAENMDLQLLLVDSDGESIPATTHFSKHAVRDHWLVFDVEP